MSSFAPPLYISDVFNASLFDIDDSSSLTLYEADRRYLKLTGGVLTGILRCTNSIDITGSITLNSVALTATATKLNYLTNSTPGTASASSALVLDSSSNITGINNLTASGTITASTTLTAPIVNAATYLVSGASANLSATVGITPGTVTASKCMIVDASRNIINMGTITQTIASGGDFITLTSSSTSARNNLKFITDNQTWELGTRGSTASNSNTFYIYNSSFLLTMSSTGITKILNSEDCTSTSTGCLQLTGGLYSAKKILCSDTLTITRNGSHLAFTNGSNSSLIEHSASPNMLRLVGPSSFLMNIGTTGCFLGTSSRDPLAPLDMGQVASNKIISLFNDVSSLYSLSANNSALQYSSASEHVFYTNCTNASPINTRRMTISSGGNVQATSFSATGFTTTGLDTNCLKGHYNSSRTEGQLFTYSYPSGGYLYTNIGGNNNISTNKDNGFVNINTSSQSFAAPLSVMGSGSFTRAAQFGFLRSTAPAADTATGFTGRSFSIYSDNGIIVQNGEINCFCDERKKKEIKPLNLAMVDKFINMMNPIQFKYKKGDQNIKYGYSAQDLVKYNFSDLVGVSDPFSSEDDEPLEEQEIVTDSGEVFYLPSDVSLSVNLLSIIPILHLYIKKQDKKINQNNKLIHELNNKMTELKEFMNNSY
jgi:hypothetical protein